MAHTVKHRPEASWPKPLIGTEGSTLDEAAMHAYARYAFVSSVLCSSWLVDLVRRARLICAAFSIHSMIFGRWSV